MDVPAGQDGRRRRAQTHGKHPVGFDGGSSRPRESKALELFGRGADLLEYPLQGALHLAQLVRT